MNSPRAKKPEKRGASVGAAPRGISLVGLLLLGVGCMVLAPERSQAFPHPPIPTPTPSPYATVEFYVMYQDLDGRAGLVASRDYPTSPEATGWLQFQDSDFSIGFPSLWFWYNGLDPSYRGRTFDFHLQIPGVGAYTGTNVVELRYGNVYTATFPPYFVIPTTSQRLGQEMVLRSQDTTGSPPPNGQVMIVRITPYIGNGDPGLGYCTNLLAAPVPRPSIDVTVTQKASGSSTETITLRETLQVTPITQTELYLGWGGFTWYYESDNSWKVADEVPPYPLVISAHADGYTTDTIVLEPQNLKVFFWNALVNPLPDRPDVFRPTGVSIRQVPPAWMQATIDEITEGILYPAPVEDQNGDGVIDVADIVAVLNQDPVP